MLGGGVGSIFGTGALGNVSLGRSGTGAGGVGSGGATFFIVRGSSFGGSTLGRTAGSGSNLPGSKYVSCFRAISPSSLVGTCWGKILLQNKSVSTNTKWNAIELTRVMSCHFADCS